MKLVPLKCPECGATIQVEEGRNKCFCTYCGTQIHVDDEVHREVHEYVYRDEARIKEAEVELEKQKNNWAETPIGFFGCVAASLVIIAVLLLFSKFVLGL